MSRLETAFEMATSAIRFGPHVTREIGQDLAELGLRRVLLITDPWMRQLPPLTRLQHRLPPPTAPTAPTQLRTLPPTVPRVP